MDRTASAYDSFQYENLPFRMSHPDWLATIGTLAGLTPPDVRTSRVLDIGCARGGHLIPLAELLPDASFVGIDLAPSQIADARDDARGIGLTNVEFRAMDVRDLSSDLGQFDYILCHGVFSWVPDDAREAVLRSCRDLLTPNGLAYVSYNTLPGWHARGMLRSMFSRVVPDGDPIERARSARTFVDMLADFVPDTLPLHSWLRNEINLLSHYSDRYLFFEHLVEENTPFYFRDFMNQAHAFDLIHVADAEVASGSFLQVGTDASQAIAQRVVSDTSTYEGRIEAQQLLDLLTLRHFRRSILTHAHHVDELRPEFDARRTAEMHVSLERLRTNELGESEIELDVDGADGLEVALDDDGNFVVTSGDPVPIVALWCLAGSPHRRLRVDELVEAVSAQVDLDDVEQQVHTWALTNFVAGEVQLTRWPRPVTYESSGSPMTSRCARWQAAQLRRSITNLRHEEVEIDDLDRALVLAMDGSRSSSQLVEAGLAVIAEGTVEVEVDDERVTDVELLRELVETKIRRLVNRAVVLAD